MSAKKKASRAPKRGASKAPRRRDLMSAKNPRGGVVTPPSAGAMTIKGATVNIN